MADYYTQFSTGIYRIKPEERSWIEQQLDPESWETSPPDWEAPIDEEMLSFEWSFEPGHEGDLERMGETFLWIRSEEWGDADQVAEFVGAFLRKFRPSDHFAMTVAWSCSKPRLDSYSGGAIFVTADDCRSFHVDTWVSLMLEATDSGRKVSGEIGIQDLAVPSAATETDC